MENKLDERWDCFTETGDFLWDIHCLWDYDPDAWSVERERLDNAVRTLKTLNYDLEEARAEHSMLVVTMAAGEDVQHTVNQILQETEAMLTEIAHVENLKECLEQQEMAKEDERSCTTKMSQAEHSNEREQKFPENIAKPGEGSVRNRNVIRSVKEIQDGLLEGAVGITPMEIDQEEQEETKEETKQEETKEGNPEEASKYLINTSRELIESVGIGIKEILYQTFQG
jgi:hypothetical protein